MRNKVPESDWKHFKKICEVALQRLCERALKKVVETAADSSSSPHERSLAVYRRIQKYDKEISSAFDDLSRSKMMWQLALIRSLELVDDSELEPLTEETKDDLKSFDSF